MTTPKQPHTPTPLTLHPYDGWNSAEIRNADGTLFLEVRHLYPLRLRTPTDFQFAPDAAAFIVRACNSHAGLVEALERLIDVSTGDSYTDAHECEAAVSRVGDAQSLALTVLKQAKGETK